MFKHTKIENTFFGAHSELLREFLKPKKEKEKERTKMLNMWINPHKYFSAKH